jgi:radical SAM superfamily enzyme YgiQ (UPF0313 family)
MKIVFIEPRSSGANVYSKLPMPLLGPVYLGTILRDRGHEVEIYNEDFFTPDYSRLDADLIGISILTATAPRGYEIADKFPREKVIIGGVHASLLPEEALLHARQVVVGEAEEVIADVVEGRLKDPVVQGRPVEDLDALPFPDFTLVKGFKPRIPIIPVSTSRGCPFDCSFCTVTKMFGRRYRFRSAENVMEELTRRGAHRYFFCDDNFTANPARTQRLLAMIEASPIRGWICQIRCDVARDKELLAAMERAGCNVVCIGLESINKETLRSFGKRQSVRQIVHAIRSIHRRGIKIHGMFVLGGEDDSLKTVWDTVRFAIREKLDTLQISILTPFPGTRVYEFLEAQKRIFTKDWSLYDGHHIVFTPKLVSARELQVTVLKAYMRYYSLTRTFLSLLTWRFRNGFFRFMGYLILRRWMAHNRRMPWLANQ